MLRKFVYWITICSLLIATLPIPRASAASFPTFNLNALPIDYSLYIAPPDAQPLLQLIPEHLETLYNIDAELQAPAGPYRTTVTIRGAADLARLKKIGVTILSSARTSAVVIADRLQLEQIAKASFFPRNTELAANLKTRTGTRLAPTSTAIELAAAVATDSDGDGLSDTEEGWWCTDPNNVDSDNDTKSDSFEVLALLAWVQHSTATRPATGKPFAGWPPNHAGCYDSDYDSVPDAVEVYVFGLNPNRESTARDKFDDGQKLFGLTNCPGSGGGCGYGALPRQVDWGVIFAEMPSWVKAPYDSPFVAAFPDPDIEVVPSSFVMTAKTTITTDHTISNGEAKTYGTSEAKGTSTSLADTKTWNNWQEVSVSTPQTRMPIVLEPRLGGNISASSSITDTKNELNRKTTNYGITMGGLAAVPILTAVACIVGAPICAGGAVIGIGIATVVGVSVATAHYFGDIQGDIDNIKQDQAISSTEHSCRMPVTTSPFCSSPDVKPATSSQNMSSQAPISAKQDRGLIVGTRYAVNTQSQLTSQKYYDSSYPLPQVPVTTVSNGNSWGGAQTETHTEYEEHTISQSQQFSSGESWGTATAVDTTHAADLTFTYRISNKGTDYAREIGSIAFNIYIGDNANPVYTYFPATDIGGAGTFTNFMPNETHTYASRAVPLTLNQIKAIDTGGHIYIVVEDFSYGVDELFYQDAINSGASFAVDNGDGLLHSYVLPTWGTETIQDVAKRFFPATEDASGNLLLLTVPHYATTTPTWTAHALTDTAWWNLYLNNLGDGSAPFKDTPATANSTVLIRMNSDTDRDGYSDRTELALGTNPNDPASHPTPSLTAATHSMRVGNVVTATMAFLNSGNYDAYGIEAVMYAPDSTVTINDNTIGGSGRVKSASQVVLGSRVMPASTTNWRGTSKPYSAGSYSGNTDKVFTFTAANPGNISQGTVNINWNDGVGNSGTVNFGSGYQAPLPVTIANGLQIGFDTGTVNTGDVFTVSARLPRDTFSYTINGGTYTTPTVVVSYNDPQGNHKFVTPVEVSDLGTNLAPYASQMLQGVGVDIATTAAFNSSTNNTVYLVANSPHPQPIVNGHLFVEFVNDAGTVVNEQVFTQTLQTGPTVTPVIFNTSVFSPTYQAGHDYTLLAFFTDSQGNIIDSHARLFSTFAADPSPILNTSPAVWNFGTVTQGAQPQQIVSIVNTGIMPLNAVVTTANPSLTLSGASGIISVPPAGTRPVTATLDTTTLSGAVAMSLTVRSNDPAHQTVTVPVVGTVSGAVGQADSFDIANRPLDKTVRVYGNVPQYNTVDFTHNIAPDTATIEPCKVYAADGTTLKGVGKYCADFNAGTVSAQVFGTGKDGPLTVTTNHTIYTPYATLGSTAYAGQPTLMVSVSSQAFYIGDEVLIHQTQGTGAGNYEFATIAGLGSYTLIFQRNLQYTYTQGGNSRAQVIAIPHFTDVTIQTGGTLTAPAWDGIWGGIMIFRATGTTTINGTVTASALGFRAGAGSLCGDATSGEGFGGVSTPNLYNTGHNGGGGGNSTGGGGGGNATIGGNPTYGSAVGGTTSGTPDLSSMIFGGGGGGGENCVAGGNGGRGAGSIIIFSRNMNVSGSITASGQVGQSVPGGSTSKAGGGGAGGTILLKSQSLSIGTSLINANGGSGGIGGTGGGANGGNGGDGRIRIEYQTITPGWSTTPSASTQQVAFYIAEKTNASTVHYIVPDTVTSPGLNYIFQFGRRYSFGVSGGTLITGTRVLSQTYSSTTMDALITNIGAGGATTMTLGIGGVPVFTSTQTITQPTTINLPSFASALNQYIISQPNASTIDIPMSVTINRPADVILTNLGVTPGSGIDLAVGANDLTTMCAGSVSCLVNIPSEGDVITPTVTLRNNGNQPASSAVIGYYAGDPNNAGRLLGNSYVAAISPGGIVTATFYWDTSGFTRTQTVYAFVDPPNAIGESLENNNIVSQTIYIKTKPDLRPASIALSSVNRVVGEAITTTIVISNSGETNAASHFTGFVASGGGFSDSQNMPTASIAATGTVTITRAFTPTIFGTYLITITADATNVITESLETNNLLTRTVFVGLNKLTLDSGNGSESAYSALNGYGYLNGSTYDFGGGTLTKTVRYDGSGQIQYRFDGLQPTRSYHLDSIYYQEGDTFTQTVSFDGISSGQTLSLVDTQPSVATMLVPSAAYADSTMLVAIQRPSGGAFRPTRFRSSPSLTAPAFVSELTLTPIDYWYVDAGNATDLAYNSTRGYGYLNGFASGSGDAVGTYRSAFTATVFYQFDNLNPGKRYTVDLTMYDAAGTTRQQSITSNGATVCGPFTLNAVIKTQCAITPTVAGRVVIGIARTTGTGPIVNEIAVEEKTRDAISPAVPPTITPSPTIPVSTTVISVFAAQWSGAVVNVSWSTTNEYKTDQFQLYRSSTINPAAWSLIRTQASQSNCAAQTNLASYNYADNNVAGGQTYYYQLSWTGTGCGGSGGTLAPIVVSGAATATPFRVFLPLVEKDSVGQAPVQIFTPTFTPTPSLTPLPSNTRTPTLLRISPALSTITPTLRASPTLTPTVAPTQTLTPTRR